MTFPFYPCFINLEKRNCLVVGGGNVARRKVETLLESGAQVTVIAPEIETSLYKTAEKSPLTLLRKPYERADIEGRFLVICATNNEEVNKQVYEDADSRNILVNIVDVPHLCSFYVPSRFSRGDLSFAISTHGSSPAMARKIRKELEKHFGNEYAVMLEILKEQRESLKERCDDTSKRGDILKKLVNETNILGIAKEEGAERAKAFAEEFISEQLS